MTDAALSEGFSGLAVVVEMTWALDQDPGTLAAYEGGADDIFEKLPLDALCVYARQRFDEKTLREAAVGAHSQWACADGLIGPLDPKAVLRSLGLDR